MLLACNVHIKSVDCYAPAVPTKDIGKLGLWAIVVEVMLDGIELAEEVTSCQTLVHVVLAPLTVHM